MRNDQLYIYSGMPRVIKTPASHACAMWPLIDISSWNISMLPSCKEWPNVPQTYIWPNWVRRAMQSVLFKICWILVIARLKLCKVLSSIIFPPIQKNYRKNSYAIVLGKFICHDSFNGSEGVQENINIYNISKIHYKIYLITNI